MKHDYQSNEQTKRFIAQIDVRERRTPSVQALLDILEVEPDDLVLDAGVGNGRFSLALTRFMAEARGRGVVFGCDTSKGNINKLENAVNDRGISQHFYPVETAPRQAHRLPFKDEQLDCILSVDWVPWKYNPLPYLQEYARVLKPCGTLVVAESNVKLTLDPPKHVSQLPRSKDRRPLLQHAGFDIFSTFDVQNYIWIERAMKPVLVLS
jgi:ubiquinone/menaquinone biosynthesis C-methylase UbiE